MGTPLGPKYVPYTYMDPLGKFSCPHGKVRADIHFLLVSVVWGV